MLGVVSLMVHEYVSCYCIWGGVVTVIIYDAQSLCTTDVLHIMYTVYLKAAWKWSLPFKEAGIQALPNWHLGAISQVAQVGPRES